ncbi:hypothetical protein Rsub_07919 [Raphidocelis subcapitata]|uniref:Uncharacterized protein n=1 Tax=Raphidocelis subcapitata TaxID=307507 RepID=A0A2V0P5Q6_9CHLO|nr:hypothetical protein Rsub_07919 [Raphidocelis subcapitata]|eukprot:GBF95204.1 hypothetical protein Rsub_07919 [Raphidocelis subcapitata]
MAPTTIDFSVGDSSRDPSGRAVDYLHSINSRRLKKHIEPPTPKEKAGTLTSSRFFGQPVPLRGKGHVRPPGSEEVGDAGHGVKRVPGKGHTLSGNVLHPDASPEQPAPRSVVRLYDHTFDSAFKGAAAVVDKPEPTHRPFRRHGTTAPSTGMAVTKRVLDPNAQPANAPVVALQPVMRTWQLQATRGDASILRHPVDPMGARPKAKFEADRPAKPNVMAPDANAVRNAFISTANSYAANKGRAVFGSSLVLG